MNMRKLIANTTDWIGWFFVEAGDKMFWATNSDWCWRVDGEEVRWFLRPWNWVATRFYDLGCWFYNVLDDYATGWAEVTGEEETD